MKKNRFSKKNRETFSQPKSGMLLLLLTAPTAPQLQGAREHLRYWPYVKAFKPFDETHMGVVIFLSKGTTATLWNYYATRSCELLTQCVKQYQAHFTLSSRHTSSFIKRYHPNGFLRPDNLLIPFLKFIEQ